jgi:moderate conductance mechanosensitive channel
MTVSLPQLNTDVVLDRLNHALDKSLDAGLYLAGALLLTFVIGRLFRTLDRYSRQLIEARGGSQGEEISKQTSTISLTVRRSLIFVIWAMALLAVLNAYGFDVRPILATAGVAGIAIGFAAQNLLKDIISGFFLLADGHIRINDVVSINGLSGVVEELSLRNTVLRGENGALHVISNGSIVQLSNLTQLYSQYVFEISAGYDADPDQVVAQLTAAAEGVRADPEYGRLVLQPLEVMGVDRFTEAGVVVKARIKTVAGQQWKVGREINRRLQKAGFAFATAQRVEQRNLPQDA